MATHELDLAAFTLDEQLDWLLEGTYFADEGGLVEDEGSDVTAAVVEADGPVRTKSMADTAVRPTRDGGAESAATERDGGQGRLIHQNAGLRAQMRAELKAKLELSAKLKAKGAPDWPLRIYIGADPTRESLHIGHMVPVVNLRKFQQLGHQVVFLIGDYTATIGDPTGQSKEREQLTHERVLETAKFYTSQAHRLLHEDTHDVAYASGSITERGAEVRYNGEWLAPLTFAQTAELAAQFSLSRIVARQDFRTRIAAGQEVGLHESLYALMQGYDAFALNCDVQVGGYDQHMNLLAGRTLQKYFAAKFGLDGEHPQFARHPETGKRVKGPHVMLTYPLLMGTDGRKMSKSWGNTIDVMDEPYDMFGKTMRISDEMIAHYIDIAVAARQAEKDAWKARIATEPMEVKKWVAHSITALYCGTDAADSAAEHFKRTVQERQVAAEDVEEVEVKPKFIHSDEPVKLAELLVQHGLVTSNKEANRLIEQGGVKLDGVPVKPTIKGYAVYEHKPGAILQVGKRKVVKLV